MSDNFFIASNYVFNRIININISIIFDLNN